MTSVFHQPDHSATTMSLNEFIVENAAPPWFDGLGYPPDLQEEATHTVLAQAEWLSAMVAEAQARRVRRRERLSSSRSRLRIGRIALRSGHHAGVMQAADGRTV